MVDVVTNIDNLIISIIQKYNGDNIDISDNSLRDNLKKIYNSELVSKLIDYIITLTINDLDVGKAYYNKTEGELTVKKLMIKLKGISKDKLEYNMKNNLPWDWKGSKEGYYEKMENKRNYSGSN